MSNYEENSSYTDHEKELIEIAVNKAVRKAGCKVQRDFDQKTCEL